MTSTAPKQFCCRPLLRRMSSSSSSPQQTMNQQHTQHAQTKNCSQLVQLPTGIYLAPMVRGSELAYRMLARQRGNATLCYSPMLRDKDVVAVATAQPTNKFMTKELAIDRAGRTNSIEETATILLHDCHPDDTPNLVVQMCGSNPDILSQATTALLDIYSNKKHNNNNNNNNSNNTEMTKDLGILPFGIDLNLGCPQECALHGNFGAFLVENNPNGAIACISAMRTAIDDYHHHLLSTNTNEDSGSILNKPLLSAKIRLLDKGIDETINFIRNLQAAGVDFVTVHCRYRIDKHTGPPDYISGEKIVSAFSNGNNENGYLPIILNGGITNINDANQVLEQTKCHAVMVATGYLNNHRKFDQSSLSSKSLSTIGHDVVTLALDYLDYAEQYPPPSYLYIQKHMRWVFRDVLQPEDDANFNKFDYTDYRVKLWFLLVRSYVRNIEQFKLFVALYVKLSSECDLAAAEDGHCGVPQSIHHLVQDVTFGSVKKAGKIEWSYA
jgi:tRNA-dihydrouridine synthase